MKTKTTPTTTPTPEDLLRQRLALADRYAEQVQPHLERARQYERAGGAA